MAQNNAGHLAGRVAVVTGAASGNGRGIAVALARSGASVMCSDIREAADPDGYDERPELTTVELVTAQGGRALFEPADVAEEGALERVASRAAAEFGRLDIWVNNAGIGRYMPIGDESLPAFARTLEVNVTGAWLGCRAAVRLFRAQERRGRTAGRIINLGSICGEIGQGEVGAYAASKGAIHAMTRDLAVELAPDRITVNALAPGFIKTRMSRPLFETEDGRAHAHRLQPWPDLSLSPADVAEAVVFLASDQAALITGIVMPVDGGVLAA